MEHGVITKTVELYGVHVKIIRCGIIANETTPNQTSNDSLFIWNFNSFIKNGFYK